MTCAPRSVHQPLPIRSPTPFVSAFGQHLWLESVIAYARFFRRVVAERINSFAHSHALSYRRGTERDLRGSSGIPPGWKRGQYKRASPTPPTHSHRSGGLIPSRPPQDEPASSPRKSIGRPRPQPGGSPWQSPFAGRAIGSVRRECLDNVTILSERHLRGSLATNCSTTPSGVATARLAKPRPLWPPLTARGHLVPSCDPGTTARPAPGHRECRVTTVSPPVHLGRVGGRRGT